MITETVACRYAESTISVQINPQDHVTDHHWCMSARSLSGTSSEPFGYCGIGDWSIILSGVRAEGGVAEADVWSLPVSGGVGYMHLALYRAQFVH
jgi:hypothetical protein